MRASVDSLPVELLDAIFEIMTAEHEALKACSLARRSWVGPAQKHLFSELFVGKELKYDDIKADVRMCKRLLSTLEASPHFALYFRHITIHIHDPDASINIARVLKQILPRLTNARSLSLKTTYNARLPYQLLQSYLRNAIHELVSRPSFESLTLHNWTFADDASNFVKLVHCCSESLKYLSLANIYFKASSDRLKNPIDLPVHLPELMEYHIRSGQMLLGKQLFVFPKLQKIKWPMHFNGSGTNRTCACTLALAGMLGKPSYWSFFIASEWTENYPPCHSLTPEKLSSLTHLELSIEAWGYSGLAMNILTHLHDILPSPSESKLESITVTFYLQGEPYNIWPECSWESIIDEALKPILNEHLPDQHHPRDTPTPLCSLAFSFRIAAWTNPEKPDPDERGMYSPYWFILGTKNYSDAYEMPTKVEEVKEMLKERFGANVDGRGQVSYDVEYSEDYWDW
ncbi:hypothetical protein ONZ45_g7821 [Pleurotus djamor]|nr:hypothetical protein ONZ45_g7821 [Pleurotus djamor]